VHRQRAAEVNRVLAAARRDLEYEPASRQHAPKHFEYRLLVAVSGGAVQRLDHAHHRIGIAKAYLIDVRRIRC
jgi:hypothetical protein